MTSELISGLFMNRRGAFKALMGASAILTAGCASGEQASRDVKADPSDFNYNDPHTNLYAFGKLWGSYDTPKYGAYHGVMYARLPGRKHQALFGYTGTGVMQSRIEPSGDVSIRGKETGFFTDLASGDILEDWLNPYTGERVKPFNFINTVGVTRTTTIPRFAFGGMADEATIMNDGMNHESDSDNIPFILPFESYGDDLMLGWDYAHGYSNPVTKDKWPKAHTGPYISPSEHFTFRTSKAEMEDKSLPSSRFVAGFSRLSEWWPWMLMGESKYKNGVIFGRMFSHKGLPSYQDIPSKLLAYIEKHHPDALKVPEKWEKFPPQGTWEKYAKTVPPERS